MPNSALPPHLKNKLHCDWTFPFNLIPRSWTSFKLSQPSKVLIGKKILDWTEKDYSCGKKEDMRRGPNPCQRHAWSWYISWPLYFTISFGKTGWYLRIGFRWDDIDDYYTFPSFRIKEFGKLKKDKEKVENKGIWRVWKCEK